MGHCEKCGSELPAYARFCGSCGARVTAAEESSTHQPAQKRKSLPKWAGLLVGVCVIGIGLLLVLVLGLKDNSAPTTPQSDTAHDAAVASTSAPPAITVSPSSLYLVGTVGRPGPSERITVRCAEAQTGLVWHVSRDVLWINVVPSTESFDLGASDFSVRVSTDGLEAGTHTATTSLSADGFDGVVATLGVTLTMKPSEDPEAKAIRDFWESSVFRPYREGGAERDVRSAVRDYAFPEYWHTKPEYVGFKNVRFDFIPDVYPRPIARVHCEAQFLTVEDREETGRTRVAYYTNTIVILQVEPGPFSASRNTWQVVEAFDYPE